MPSMSSKEAVEGLVYLFFGVIITAAIPAFIAGALLGLGTAAVVVVVVLWDRVGIGVVLFLAVKKERENKSKMKKYIEEQISAEGE